MDYCPELFHLNIPVFVDVVCSSNTPSIPVGVIYMLDIMGTTCWVASHHRLITRLLSHKFFSGVCATLICFTFVRPLIWYFESIPSALLGKVLVTIASQPFSFLPVGGQHNRIKHPHQMAGDWQNSVSYQIARHRQIC